MRWMMRTLGIGVIVVVALLAAAISAGQPASSAAVTAYVDDDDPTCGGNAPCYSSIQPAAFAVSSAGGGTVLVRPGHYAGGIAFYGSVAVKSTNGPAYTIIDGAGQATGVMIYSPGGSVEGFTIRGGGGFVGDISNGWGVFLGIAGHAAGVVRNNEITGNYKGGVGVHASYSNVQVDVRVEGNLVTQNGLDQQLSAYASGIHIRVPASNEAIGSVRIENNVVAFNGNTNSVPGGGIVVETCCPYPSDPSSQVSVRVVNNTVYGNTAAYGGGLAGNASDLQLHNNIFFANNASAGSDLYLVQGALSAVVNSNVIGDGQFQGISGNISSNPLLADPGTSDFELAGTSPAIDAGDNSPCPGIDQRARQRPIDGDNDAAAICDIGAYEYCPAMPDVDGDLAGDACDAPGTGNVDCSGPVSGVSSVDALKVLRHNAGLSVAQSEPCLDIGLPRALAPPDDWRMGDVDCSGVVNSVDALKILRAAAGLTVSQTLPCAPVIGPPP